jgi:hypothetical protein
MNDWYPDYLYFYLIKTKHMKSIIPALLLIIMVTSSCNHFNRKRVRGDGNIVTRERQLNGFNGVDVGGAMDVVVSQDSAYSVKIETDNNLQDLIDVFVDHGVLHVYTRDGFNPDPSRKTVVYVSAPQLKEFYVSGASSISSVGKIQATETVAADISGASQFNVELQLSGASQANVKGETRDLSIQSSGSSDIKAYELLSENANVDISGAGSAEVYASIKLDADASGASKIKYRGNATVNSNSSGASSIVRNN